MYTHMDCMLQILLQQQYYIYINLVFYAVLIHLPLSQYSYTDL